jgi:hypothetical protein
VVRTYLHHRQQKRNQNQRKRGTTRLQKTATDITQNQPLTVTRLAQTVEDGFDGFHHHHLLFRPFPTLNLPSNYNI